MDEKFEDFAQKVAKGFEQQDKKITLLAETMKRGFDKKIDILEVTLTQKFDRKIDSLAEMVAKGFEGQTNYMDNKFVTQKEYTQFVLKMTK